MLHPRRPAARNLHDQAGETYLGNTAWEIDAEKCLPTGLTLGCEEPENILERKRSENLQELSSLFWHTQFCLNWKSALLRENPTSASTPQELREHGRFARVLCRPLRHGPSVNVLNALLLCSWISKYWRITDGILFPKAALLRTVASRASSCQRTAVNEVSCAPKRHQETTLGNPKNVVCGERRNASNGNDYVGINYV